MDDLVSQLIEQNKLLISALQPKNETRNKNVTGVNFEKFDESQETFESFLERFEAFLDIQNVPSDKRAKTLISGLSAKLYNLLKNLLAPKNPAEADFETLKTTLKDHLHPKPLVIPSRHIFLNRKQHEGESINAYLAELRSLAIPCNYKEDLLNTMLRDVFVSGLRDRSTLDRLFEEDDIDLDRTVKIALAMEKASKSTQEIIGRPADLKEFKANKKKEPKRFVYNKTKVKNNFVCNRCKGIDHSGNECKFKSATCNYCHKVGHLAKACFSAARAKQNKHVKQKQIHAEPECSDENSVSVPLHELNSVNEELPKRPPIMISVKIENTPVQMEMDTGGTVSVMSIRNFRKFSKKKIQPTKLIFKTYKGDEVVPLGYVTVKVEYNNIAYDLNLYLVKENLDTIFGREWLYKIPLNWNAFKTIKSSVKTDLPKLLKEFENLFSEDLGEIKNYECKLELKEGANPVFCRARPVPFALKQRVDQEIDRLEKEGIIEKTSISDWATPIVPIMKRNGTIRICADYSVTINKNLKVQKHPLPRTEDIFASLSDGKVFSKVDFSQAYLQMKVSPESQKLLTLNTQKGLYIPKRLMYGINAAPAIWQKYIESVFQGLEGVEVFFDDARIAAPDNETHCFRLRKFFERCQEHGLKINKDKSKFFQSEIEFLGYKINSKGLSKTSEKIDAIKNAKAPQTVHEVQSFMGLVNFYSRFSKDLATLAYPLYNLTKATVTWKWDRACQKAFENVKNEICSDKILAHYDPNLPIVLSSDASPVGLGAVLSHKFPDGSERPIAFASRTLSSTEQRYSQIDKEALAIVWSVKKFYLYLKGNRFTLITDHKPLVSIFSSKKGLPVLSATRLLHYALLLQAYNFDIVYRSSKEHGNADFLSRLPTHSEQLAIQDDVNIFHLQQIETIPVTARDLAKETEVDEELSPLLRILKSGGELKGREMEYSLQDNCIMYGHRVCIPKRYRKNVLEELHHGHLGAVKMKAIARSYVFWQGIDKDIESTAKNCLECAKHQIDPPKVKVHHWEYPNAPMDRIHVDYAGPIFEHMFLIIVDAHSKWLEAYPVKTSTTFKTIECLRDFFSRFGLPILLVSDNGSQFTSHEFETFLKSNGIKHKTTAPFKPSSNGQAERYVFTVKQSLRTMQNYPGTLKQKLSTFLMQYRKAPNMTTLQSPSMLMLKREIRTRIDLLRPDLKGKVEEKVRKGTYEFFDRGFNVGDRVAVRNYRTGDTRWKFGSVKSKDGQLHYTVNVNGQLWRRHIDQIRDGGDIQENSNWTQHLHIPVSNSESRPEPASSQHPDPPQASELPRAQTSPTKKTSSVTLPRSTPTSTSQQVPFQLRRSQRIRRPPQKLNL